MTPPLLHCRPSRVGGPSPPRRTRRARRSRTKAAESRGNQHARPGAAAGSTLAPETWRAGCGARSDGLGAGGQEHGGGGVLSEVSCSHKELRLRCTINPRIFGGCGGFRISNLDCVSCSQDSRAATPLAYALHHQPPSPHARTNWLPAHQAPFKKVEHSHVP